MQSSGRDTKIKPIVLDTKYNIVGFIVVVGAILGVALKWTEFKGFFFPNYVFLNWRFFVICIALTILSIWFLMNSFWTKEYDAHEFTKKDRDNLMDQLKVSENERLTDVITGIPNTRSLQKDIAEYFTARSGRKMQFILIDLKDFRKINKRFGYIRTNNLLRMISQTIYKKMRRNEDMYKYDLKSKKSKKKKFGFYRVYPGGDEFAFIIEGDQSDAIGFCNRLVDQFAVLSKRSLEVLGEEVKLSFHCAIIEMDPRDTFEDIFAKAEECYDLSKKGTEDFTICWHPNNLEVILSSDRSKKFSYDKCRELFEIQTLQDMVYH